MGEPDDITALTPVERIYGLAFKREDKWYVDGARGAKARSAWVRATMDPRPPGLVSSGTRISTQPMTVACIARQLNIPCHIFTAWGATTPEIEAARDAGATIELINPGYNPLLEANAKKYAAEMGFRLIPVEDPIAVEQTAEQTANIPDDILRIVIPVGSAMRLCGVLLGLHRRGRSTPVLGVSVGSQGKVLKALNKYVPKEARHNLTIIQSPYKYQERGPKTNVYGIEVDPIYEAKCLQYLRTGDLLWLIGIRPSSLKEG